MGGLMNPANPASPISPMNPANPASPLSPLNPIWDDDETETHTEVKQEDNHHIDSKHADDGGVVSVSLLFLILIVGLFAVFHTIFDD
jgi:hypothetical protein